MTGGLTFDPGVDALRARLLERRAQQPSRSEVEFAGVRQVYLQLAWRRRSQLGERIGEDRQIRHAAIVGEPKAAGGRVGFSGECHAGPARGTRSSAEC